MEIRVKKIALLFLLTVILYVLISIIYILGLPTLVTIEIRIGVLTRILEGLFSLICLFFYLIGSTRARLIQLGFLGFIVFGLLDSLITPFFHDSGNLLLAFFQVVVLSISSITVYELTKSLYIEKIESQFGEKAPIKITIGFFLANILILSYGVYNYYKSYYIGFRSIDPFRSFFIDKTPGVLSIVFLFLLIYMLLFKKKGRYTVTSAFLVFNSTSVISSFIVLAYAGFDYEYVIESFFGFLWVLLTFIFVMNLRDERMSMFGKYISRFLNLSKNTNTK